MSATDGGRAMNATDGGRAMNATAGAVRLGLRRGWTEFVQSVRSPQDQGFYVFTAVAVVGYLVLRRNSEVDGVDLSYPALALPSILGALLAFGVVVGPAYALAMEREDGTLLRLKTAPHGLTGYFTGQLLFHSLGLVPQFLVILVPSFLLFDGVMSRGLAGWLTVTWVLVLGLLATMPIGMVIGALVPGTQKVGTWGMLPVMVLAGILPAEAAVVEVGGSWRTGTTVLVLAAWAAIGVAVTPAVLRRMSRRQSGSQVEAARQSATQWVH
jgi:ABC-2 type transport system permease protein